MSDFTNSFFRRNNDSYGYAKQDYDTFKKNYDSFDFDAYLKQQREERERQEELRRLQEEQEKNSGFFKGGDSNFFVGALNSYIDFSADIGQGFFRTLEGVADFLQYSAADSQKMGSDLLKGVFGDNPVSDFYSGMSNWFKENAAFDSTGSLFGTNENAQETLFGNQWRKDINEKSYLGDMADSIGEGIGNIGAMAAMSAVGGEFLGAAGIGVTETGALTTGGKLLLSGGNSYMSAYGNSRSEAYKNGATDSEAQKYAFVNGLAEAISEQVFDSMPGIKSAGFADKIGIKDALANKIKSGLGTNAGKVFLKLTGGFEEGAEEMISNALVAVGQDIIHSIDQNYNYNMENQTGNVLEDLKNALVSEDSIKSFMSAGLTSVILGVGGDTLTTAQRNQVINAFAKDNNMSFKEAKQLLGGETLNQAQEQVQREIKRDNAEISNNVELEETAKNRIVNYMKQSNRENIESGIETLVKEEARKAGIELNEEQLKSETEKIRNRYIDEVNNPELYRTFSQKTDNEKDAALAKSFEDAKLNDSKETHKIYKTLKTLQDNNENSNYKVVSNEKLVDMGILEKNDKGEYVLPDGTKATINGFKQGDTIYINADGLNPYEATIGHEIGEAIKASDREAYSELKTMVKDLFNPSEKELQAYSKLYNGNTDSIEDEYVNDKLGELFKNDKLIDKIADNRTILQKFIDEIKRLVKYKFSNQEQRQLMDLQKKLEDKYVELYKQADFKSEVDESLPFYEEEKPQFSLSQDSQGRELSKEQQDYFKDSKVRDDNGRLKAVYHMTNADFNKIDFNKNYQGVFWFASNKQDLEDGTVSAVGTRDKANSKIMELYANIKNPAGWKEYDNYGIGQLKEMGYDGVILNEDDGSFVGFVFNESNQIKNIDNTNPTSSPDIRYSLSVEQANTGTDNTGRELSNEQKEYFKNSKVTDENGNLIKIYHTTTDRTAQFNEFNPVGSQGYRYGNQVVNFFTDSKEMSGSYADQDYKMANTKPIKSMSDVNDVLNEYNSQGFNEFKVEEKNGKYVLTDNYNNNVINKYNELTADLTDGQKEFLNNFLKSPKVDIIYYYTDYIKDTGLEEAVKQSKELDLTQETLNKFNNIKKELDDSYLDRKKIGGGGFVGYDVDNIQPGLDLIKNYIDGQTIESNDIYTFNSEKELYDNLINTIENNVDRFKTNLQYEGYANITNPYIVDAKGKQWNSIEVDNLQDLKNEIKEKWDIPERQLDKLEGNTLNELNKDLTKLGYQLMLDEYGDLGLFTKEGQLAIDMVNVNDVMQEIRADLDNDLNTPISTNDIVFQALAENKLGANYDGVIIKNTIDYGGGAENTDTPNNIYVTFKPDQFKAADNVSPTQNADIRYSLSTDSEGRELNEQQQDYFKDSKVRDEQGRLMPMYHGTPSGDFTIFHPGSYFSSNKEYAQGYENTWASSISSGKEATNPKTYEVYLNIKKPFTLQDNQAKDIYINEYIKGGNSLFYDPYTDYTDTINNLDEIDWTEGEDLKEWLQENHPEYDGLILDEGGDGGYGEAEYRWRGKSFVPFNSNQIKNVDNLNPTTNEDIRYSLSGEAIIENNEDIGGLSLKPSPYQTLRPKVRGGWNIDKIQKQLKGESSSRVNSKDISAFDNLDDVMNNLFYHGSISAHDNLKAGSTLQENQRTGGYGEAYHTISLSGNKNIASNFASMGSRGSVMPVILKKNANVIEMPNIEDSIELEDILPELWDKGIDAVKIGDWDIETKGYGEQEIVILNPRAIMTLPAGTTYFENYHKPKFTNMTNEELRSALDKTYQRALQDDKLTPEKAEVVKSRYEKILGDSTQFSLSQQEQESANNLLKVVESYDDYLRTLPSYQQLQERQSTEETNLPYTDDTHGILTKADYKNKKIELFDKKMDTISNRMEEQAKRFARQNLELSNKNKQELTELLQEYTGLTREGIFSSDAREKIKDFVKNHSRQEFVEEIVNEDVRDLQKAIRKTEFIIDKESAGEFADGITAFKKNNPGLKIKYGKPNIDSVYQELAETYPGMLETDVNDKDIPFILADFLKKPYRQFNNKNVQVFELSDEEIDNVANKIYYGLTNNAISEEELQNIANEISEKVEDKYARQMASQKYRDEAREAIEQIGIENIKDKKRGIQYKINTMKRNLRDIMDRDSAQLMYDKYFKPITIHNAQSEVDKQSYVERIQKYGLTNDESVYTQMLGEQKYNPESDVTQAQLDEYASKHNIDKQKCTEAVEEFRNIYDELIVRVNESLKANGYKPIEYRQGYFPHFIEDKPTSLIGKMADKLGWHIEKGTLPTDIASLTEGFKPGKTWTSFSQRRTGDATDYNALKGMDNYLRGAMDLIYHTEDIQRLRALENEVRYQYSEKGMQEKIDAIYANDELSPEEKAQEISLLVDNQKNNPLGNFVTELRDYTNSLANKKSILDRGMEQTLGRDWYSIMNNINGRVSANMVGANISSAMTNFIPLTQAWSQVSTKNLMRGMYESIKNTIKNDGFDQNSVYLTNRTQQADTLYKTLGNKINEKLGIPFEAVDSFTSNAIVRAKYYENLEKGMSEQQAIENADEFAKDVMAGRSKGDQPTIFNTKNPIYKLFTAFQLEVNNQYGYMFKDVPADLADEAKDKLAAAFVKMFLGAWIYNFITEKITGRKAAFSPIDMVVDEYKTATNENLDFAGKVETIAKDIAEEVPFAGGMMGGGRLPIQAAIPYDNPLSMITSTIQDVGGAFDSDESKKNTAINNLKKEWMKPVYYLGLPFAGGQIKKTAEGLAMYDENLPTPGSYTSSGKLRFEADTSPLGVLQSAVFGQYASKNAREYFDKGYSPLSEKQINEAMDANLPIAEYREVNKGISEAKKIAKENGESQSEAQYDYIYNLPISMEQKNSLINSKLGTSENVTDDNGFIKYTDGSKTYWYDSQNDIVYNSKYREMSNIDIDDLTKYSNKKDLTNYGDYGSLEEFNYANNNPSKYKVIQQITDYNSFKKYKDDLTAIKDNYNDGTKAGQNKAKQEVFNYINGLELNVIQKLMLQKMAGGYSINNYKSQIRNYIQNLNMTAEEKKELDDELF